MLTIENPIIRGFNADPSIVRVNDDYYIAVSTFEWFPGVGIFHSSDLKNWKLICHPLDDREKLDMIGIPDSGGIYAPCLSYADGLFYLVYTNVKNHTGRFWDCSNYLITAENIYGPWSQPIYLNGSGIDPSLFHDENGKKWIVNVVLSHRDGGKAGFPHWSGISLTEYSFEEKKLVGEPKYIFYGSKLGTTEGPHLYKRNGYYYLLTAEGGTFYKHAVTMARSRNIDGPYEIDPENPILTSRYDCTIPLQRTGHADIVETQSGEWYMVHLCGCPMPSNGRSTMGRETAIQKVKWTEDGWLRLMNGKHTAELEVEGPSFLEEYTHETSESNFRDNFDNDILDVNWQSLRIPLPETMCTLKERPGYLRLFGHESLSSKFYQSFIAKRQQNYCYSAKTCVEFYPSSFQQMAGLVCYYDTSNYIYLFISSNEAKQRVINVMIDDLDQFSYSLKEDIIIPTVEKIFLKAVVNYSIVRFYYSLDEQEWILVGEDIDYSKLSDEYLKERGVERFTGSFVGICCQDFTGKHIPADFDYFVYQETPEKEKLMGEKNRDGLNINKRNG